MLWRQCYTLHMVSSIFGSLVGSVYDSSAMNIYSTSEDPCKSWCDVLMCWAQSFDVSARNPQPTCTHWFRSELFELDMTWRRLR